MALIGLVNLTERLLNQTAGQTQATTPSKASANNAVTAATGDQFTASAQNTAQAAGLFTVSQFAVFSAAAEVLLAQAPAAQASPANTPAPATNLTAQPGTHTAVAANAATASQALAAATTLATVAALAPANALQAAAAPAATANVENQLQALNNALAALGVSKAEMRKIDSIAVLIHDFNPTAFTSLVHQLEGLAQDVAPQTPATSANTNAANATNTKTGGFHVQELLVRFASAGAQGAASGANNATNGTGAVRAPGGNVAPFPVPPATLQAEEIQLSFADNNGHTLHVRAAAEAARGNTPTGGNQAPAQTRAATA
jgi:hypothetical protein